VSNQAQAPCIDPGYLTGDKVVVTQLDGMFESAWQATAAPLAHYRTGIPI